MSKTIVFKKEFESKLKELRIKTRFVKNTKDYCKQNNRDLQKHLDFLNQSIAWYTFIDHAFSWCMTPEYETEQDYWAAIAFL